MKTKDRYHCNNRNTQKQDCRCTAIKKRDKKKVWNHTEQNNLPKGYWFDFKFFDILDPLSLTLLEIPTLIYAIMKSSAFFQWAALNWIILDIIASILYGGTKKGLAIILIILGIFVDVYPILKSVYLQQYNNILESVLFSIGIPVVLGLLFYLCFLQYFH